MFCEKIPTIPLRETISMHFRLVLLATQRRRTLPMLGGERQPSNPISHCVLPTVYGGCEETQRNRHDKTVVDTKPEGDPVPTLETREKSHATEDQNGPGAH